jgi:hypothetical protein
MPLYLGDSDGSVAKEILASDKTMEDNTNIGLTNTSGALTGHPGIISKRMTQSTSLKELH